MMPLVWKIDVMKELNLAGYTTYRLQREKLLNSQICVRLAKGELVKLPVIDKICALLQCQPGDLLEYKFSPEDLPPNFSDKCEN